MITLGFVRPSVGFALALLLAPSVSAQSLTSGTLSGAVVNELGRAVPDATVSLERDGTAVRTFLADRSGRFAVPVIAAGRYAVLTEQIGYQPLRLTDVLVTAGREVRLVIRLVQRPPPVPAAEERPASVAVGGAAGRVVTGGELHRFDRRREVADVSRGISEVDAPRDGAPGFAVSANGLPAPFSRFLVDGVEERLLMHPGAPSRPAPTPLFPRGSVDQATVMLFGDDAEWRGTQGAILAAQSARGGRPALRPFVSFSGASLGGATADNPADSSASSVQAGIAMGGSIKADTATWHVHAEYQRLATPSASPFPADVAVATIDQLRGAAGRDVDNWLAPVVRRSTSMVAGGRVDWRFGATTAAFRAGYGSWNEDNPLLDDDLGNGAGSRVEGTDASASASLTTLGEQWLNEARVGYSTASRDWTGAGLTAARLVIDGLAIGDNPVLAGAFSERSLELSDALSYRMGNHQLKVGGVAQRRTHAFGRESSARFDHGTVADLAAGNGVFTQVVRGEAEDIAVTGFAAFAQDAWQVTREVTVTVGVHVDKENLPSDAVAANNSWASLAGVNTGLLPSSKTIIAPRGAIAWSAAGAGRTVVRAGAGIVPGRYDMSAFSEVAAHDGGVTIRRAHGVLDWPTVPGAAATRPTLTLYGSEVRRPRSFAAEASITHLVSSGTSVSVRGGYHHADYMLQRTDLNRVASPVATTADGRAVFGSLEQHGGLIAPAVGSNRRFDEFDAVFGLTSTGYVDYYEATVSLERRMARGVSLIASYTWSDAADNLPGQAVSDPFDRVSPFAGQAADANWDDGVSDLDVPHRIAVTIDYSTDGRLPIGGAARFRYRSGLPFTPGYRGVDANGDGSFRNDPAFLATNIPGLDELMSSHGCLSRQAGTMAARNSCREDAVQSLDLHGSIGLPFGSARRAALTVDLFNIMTTDAGVLDRAAVRVNPLGAITTDGTGRLVLPLVANPRFGTILSRRTDPRVLRIGVRLET